MNLQFQAEIQKVQTMVDGGNKIILATQELNAEDMAKLFGLKGLMWACFSEAVIKEADLKIPDVLIDEGEKSPTQRLKDRMLAYYHATHGNFDGFNEWRVDQLDKFGQRYLEKLN